MAYYTVGIEKGQAFLRNNYPHSLTPFDDEKPVFYFTNAAHLRQVIWALEQIAKELEVGRKEIEVPD